MSSTLTDCPEGSSDADSPVPGLLVKDTLCVRTPGGDCRIELCLGDITKLLNSDKVDVILVSAFGGSYSKGIGVMGALYKNLGIDVDELKKSHQEEDLRALYSCWWTKPLPDHLPYHRLLCFESRGGEFSGIKYYDPSRGARGRPQELVSHAFRCLVPILNNQDGSVITPLLNAGSQGCDECEMLKGMVENAVSWMKAGLPLRLLKIVIYAKVLSKTKAAMILQRPNDDDILKLFSDLKERFETKLTIPKEVKLDFDVYLSYSSKDQKVVDDIQATLQRLKPDIRIYASQQKVDGDAIWQQDIYSVMTRCARVITVLSPNYLESPDCLEQYNIALCCNRQAQRDILAPFFVETVTLPTYMGLVQYADCRDDSSGKIASTCQQLIKTLPVMATDDVEGEDESDDDPFCYDIFVSYSHSDSEAAKHIVDTLQGLDPNLRIFYDIQELKTGHAWQQTLYHSIDGSRSMLAVLSSRYLRSAVCREEYSLAQTKHLCQDKLRLIPVQIEELETEIASFSEVPMVTATPDIFKTVMEKICTSLVQWLHGQEFKDPIDELTATFSEATVSDKLNVSALMEEHRKKTFKCSYKTTSLLLQHRFPPKCFISQQESENSTYKDVVGEVILSFHPQDRRYAVFFQRMLELAAPRVVVRIDASSEQERRDQLENARHVVAFLSPHYIESPKQVEEFHISLWRQRVSPVEAPLLLPVQVLRLPRKPTYFHIVGSVVDLWDSMWPSLEVFFPMTAWLGSGEFQVSRDEVLALMELAKMTLDLIVTAQSLPKQEGVTVRPALRNIVEVKAEIKEMTNATKRHSWKPSDPRDADALENCCCIICRRSKQLLGHQSSQM
ncbi:uncharacterized protein [Diadema setosum]|uniref:uncharacterized protein n=1 Tax=Diadema setosum TaxID=31175 RepID=UPI003B3A7FF4